MEYPAILNTIVREKKVEYQVTIVNNAPNGPIPKTRLEVAICDFQSNELPKK